MAGDDSFNRGGEVYGFCSTAASNKNNNDSVGLVCVQSLKF